MNYLAHFALSGNNEEIVVGNYLGDSLRGVDTKSFSEGIQKGIKLHRFIDTYTDHHPIFLSAKKWFSESFDKYSAVLLDVCFDHFLAKNFSRFYPFNLEEFAEKKYAVIKKNYSLLPEKAKGFYGYMIEHKILSGYAQKENILKVLHGLTYRIKKKALLYEAYDDFILNYDALEKLFFDFYPELMKACKQFCNENGIEL